MPGGPIPSKLSELLAELSQIDDWDLKSDLLIEYAERFKPVPKEIAEPPYPEQNKVPSCESEAYVFTEDAPGGSKRFYFAILNPQGISAMAMAVIIDECISGAPLEEIASISDDLVYDVFGRGISMGKGLGLRSMVQVVKALAAKS